MMTRANTPCYTYSSFSNMCKTVLAGNLNSLSGKSHLQQNLDSNLSQKSFNNQDFSMYS